MIAGNKHKAGVLTVCAADEMNKPVVIDLIAVVEKAVADALAEKAKVKDEPASVKPEIEKPAPVEIDSEEGGGD